MIPRQHELYSTTLGQQVWGDSRQILRLLPEKSIDLIVTSPPFALLRKKTYGNKGQEEYVAWLIDFGHAAHSALKDTGSFVLDLGGAYKKGRPVRSLHNYRVLLSFCDNIGYRLAEEFFWYNPAKLPSPIEWVNKQKIRAKDAVNTVWWFSKTDHPKADVRKVLVPYSDRMKTLLQDPEKFYQPKKRPSGHDISRGFGNGNTGAIPSNLLQIPNTDSNSHYQRACKAINRKRHPARFPPELPRFFVLFLTDLGDLVVDIFSGSNTTGYVAEQLGRRWLSIELDAAYATLSAIRFMEGMDNDAIKTTLKKIQPGHPVKLTPTHVPQRSRPKPVAATRSGRSDETLPLFD